MRISHLRTNQIQNPLGFELNRLSLSWITESGDSKSVFQKAAQVTIATDENFDHILFDSGKSSEIDSLAFTPDIQLKARTRYYWRVTVWGDAGDQIISEKAWFETAKMDEPWAGKWIAPDMDKDIHPLIRRNFNLPAKVVSARLYICGLGLYEAEINGKKVGDEYFAPGYNAYDFWLQYQTYDVTEQVKNGENTIGIKLGNGWYKGRFGLDGGYLDMYGSEFAVKAEVIVMLADGSTFIVATDEAWKCARSPITFSGIYDGEFYDANLESKDWSLPIFDDSNWKKAVLTEVHTEQFQARLSLPVKIMEERKPIDIIYTPAGETVLDFGQEMTGWVRFRSHSSKGAKLHLQYGEILQNGNFYRENLRTAKAEYIYISDGIEKEVQPNFTFYGFRYVKLTGFEGEINLADFTGCVIYSDIETTGAIETSNPFVNQLFQNVLWGQKGNFLDVPTDCPQRDERMGWTGDAQVFAPTACYNMYSPAFFQKYMFDLREEQKRMGGSVPNTVPRVKSKEGGSGLIDIHGSSVWGDAATIIPWTLFVQYGDKELLRSQFDTMKDWVDYIKKMDEESGGKRLWQEGFHFGDWLALDNNDPNSPFGGTEIQYIASAYYCYSSELVAKTAAVLGNSELAERYAQLANEIREAIIYEYFSPSGKSTINTQTAMIVALYMNLIPERMRPRVIKDLRAKLRENKMHLTTGFVGTPYFCPVLSENGANEDAYTLLLNDDYPSWLYSVKMGATTIWERWNSVLPDGSISDTGMNSLNHYAYGSIAQWMYQQMCGINPVEEVPGYRKINISPKVNGKLTEAKAELFSASGYIESGWKINDDGSLTLNFTIPFNSTANVVLPDAALADITVNGQPLSSSGIKAYQQDSNLLCELVAGNYTFDYVPTQNYLLTYSSHNTIKDLLNNEAASQIFKEVIPEIADNDFYKSMFLDLSPRQLLDLPMLPKIPIEKFEQLDKKLEFVRQ
ncbi:alpha-L-rhamnosidase [Neobacillus niacini]|uniref:alpha-L-rhamnosidase n=1 Tax=Neobacillus niacini TaxID=86668 RepID=UPI0030006BF5